jgi:hypothetical protein
VGMQRAAPRTMTCMSGKCKKLVAARLGSWFIPLFIVACFH